MSNARFDIKLKWFLFIWIVGGVVGAILFGAIGMVFSGESGMLLALPGVFLGWYVSRWLIFKSVPDWKELKKKIANEIKRIDENEDGVTRQESLEKLNSKANKRCVVEGYVHSKEFTGPAWILKIADGDDVICCNFLDKGESKKIEKLKQKTKDGEGSFIKAIGYLGDKGFSGTSCTLNSCGIL